MCKMWHKLPFFPEISRKKGVHLLYHHHQHFNVGSTLFQRCVENKTKCNVGFSTLQNFDTTSVPDIDSNLYQRCFNLASTLVKTILNLIGLVMIMDMEIGE